MYISPVQLNVNRQFVNRNGGRNSTGYNHQIKGAGCDSVSFEGLNWEKYNPAYRFCENLFRRSQEASRRRFSPCISELNGKIKEVLIPAKGHHNIYAYDINPDNMDKYIIFFHGSSQNITNTQLVYNEILNSKFAVLAPEYTGFGKNKPARTDEYTMERDINAALKYLKSNKNIKPENIGIVGHSLGGFAAIRAAEKFPESSFVILISPVNSLFYEVDNILNNPKFKVSKFMKFVYSKFPAILKPLDKVFCTEDRIGKCKMPVYIMHSSNDTLIPVDSSRALAGKSKTLRELIILPTGGHALENTKLNTLRDILSKINECNE